MKRERKTGIEREGKEDGDEERKRGIGGVGKERRE